MQLTKALPAKEARSLLVELMHEGYDTICSPIDENGMLTVTWPASETIGKQLPEEGNRSKDDV